MYLHVLNRAQPENPLIVENEENLIEEINTGVIEREEIIKAMKKLKNGKSGGIDGITAEILKADMTTTVKYLEKLFKAIWNTETIPTEWNKGLIVKIPKKVASQFATIIEASLYYQCLVRTFQERLSRESKMA